MKAKWIEREEARRLREAGVPYKRIAKRLGVSVGSVHRWTRDIELTPEQRERNRSGPDGPQSPETVARRAAACSETGASASDHVSERRPGAIPYRRSTAPYGRDAVLG